MFRGPMFRYESSSCMLLIINVPAVRVSWKPSAFSRMPSSTGMADRMVTALEANVKEPGEIVLNAKLLSSMISRMPAGQISILSADNGKTTIKSGVAEFEIQSIDVYKRQDVLSELDEGRKSLTV